MVPAGDNILYSSTLLAQRGERFWPGVDEALEQAYENLPHKARALGQGLLRYEVLVRGTPVDCYFLRRDSRIIRLAYKTPDARKDAALAAALGAMAAQARAWKGVKP